MVFDPKTTKYPYPEYTDQHYLKIKKDNGLVFDENYPYVDTSKKFSRKVNWVRFLLRVIVFPMTKIKMGLKVKGRKNLKRYKDVLSNGVISISNHVHLFDYLAITYAIRGVRPHVLTWAPNIRGENSKLVRLVGGIPIPEKNMKATLKYIDDLHKLLDNHGWLHVYAEGSMWEYYQPIRPFKKGASRLACMFNKPILPMAFSYRKANFIRRILFKQPAVFTLSIGTLLFKDENLNKSEQELDLLKRSHDAVCYLANINPQENIYETIFHNSKRIDYYK